MVQKKYLILDKYLSVFAIHFADIFDALGRPFWSENASKMVAKSCKNISCFHHLFPTRFSANFGHEIVSASALIRIRFGLGVFISNPVHLRFRCASVPLTFASVPVRFALVPPRSRWRSLRLSFALLQVRFGSASLPLAFASVSVRFALVPLRSRWCSRRFPFVFA